jgi:hypothetical protein
MTLQPIVQLRIASVLTLLFPKFLFSTRKYYANGTTGSNRQILLVRNTLATIYNPLVTISPTFTTK